MVRFFIIRQNVNMATNAILYCGLTPTPNLTESSNNDAMTLILREAHLAEATLYVGLMYPTLLSVTTSA